MIPEDLWTEFESIGKSECRRLEHFESDQLIYVLNEYAFGSMSQKHRDKLLEHKSVILEYFKTCSIDGRRFGAEKKEIAKALSGTNVALPANLRKVLITK